MDAKTIEAARRGDRAAQAAILRQLQDPIFRVCRSLSLDAHSASDATQETAVRLLRSLHEFRGGSTLTTWALGIAINVVREMRRARTPDERVASRLADGRTPAVDPRESAQQSESTDVVRAAIDELPERQRQALVLRFFEDMSVSETAAAMGCATGTVKATVHQALRSLRERLRQLA